ncbi:MAG TPA: hypothetical protein VNO21_00365, partial [Polyangiaceae bacterium]|nr:hypothetical protein [Polyangiaceae bacterium]
MLRLILVSFVALGACVALACSTETPTFADPGAGSLPEAGTPRDAPIYGDASACAPASVDNFAPVF